MWNNIIQAMDEQDGLWSCSSGTWFFFFTLASKEVHTDAVASIGFVQKALKIAKFTGKQLFESLFFNKVAD